MAQNYFSRHQVVTMRSLSILSTDLSNTAQVLRCALVDPEVKDSF